MPTKYNMNKSSPPYTEVNFYIDVLFVDYIKTYHCFLTPFM